ASNNERLLLADLLLTVHQRCSVGVTKYIFKPSICSMTYKIGRSYETLLTQCFPASNHRSLIAGKLWNRQCLKHSTEHNATGPLPNKDSSRYLSPGITCRKHLSDPTCHAPGLWHRHIDPKRVHREGTDGY